MWPLSFFLFFAIAGPQMASPQQQPLDVVQDFHHLQITPIQRQQMIDRYARSVMEQGRNTCFTMRSYVFRRHDGHAPVPVGSTTCTPASVLRQRQVSPEGVKFVPLGAHSGDQ
jgi:hypothetical protein